MLYTPHLTPTHDATLIPYYKAAIENIATHPGGRSTYTSLVRYLLTMSKLQGGETVAKELSKQLLETYRNRPAMRDEFKGLPWISS
ncbi:hypothetical protein [Algivirga pacifica]|uniref:Uncharacterized protein n=1 Tax=Algivirga pacifica TaxID=1162670 RepID=A0ABP9DD18_9BACT